MCGVILRGEALYLARDIHAHRLFSDRSWVRPPHRYCGDKEGDGDSKNVICRRSSLPGGQFHSTNLGVVTLSRHLRIELRSMVQDWSQGSWNPLRSASYYWDLLLDPAMCTDPLLLGD